MQLKQVSTVVVNIDPASLYQQDKPQMQQITFTFTHKGKKGRVHCAEMDDSGEKVVVKSLQDGTSFHTELECLRRLRHCNIIELKYYYTNKQEIGYMIMDRMPTTLRDYCDSVHTIPRLDTKLYMYQLLQGLHYLHKSNISHRNLCPEHLLLDRDSGVLKMCGFGSATYSSSRKKPFPDVGTPKYRAPEILFRCKNPTDYVDIWSAGCILAELLNYGMPLFRGVSIEEEIESVASVIGTPTVKELYKMEARYDFHLLPDEQVAAKPWLQVIKGEISEDAEVLCSKMLCYSPDDRLTARQIINNKFFDELTSTPFGCLPNGNPMPPVSYLDERRHRAQTTKKYIVNT